MPCKVDICGVLRLPHVVQTFLVNSQSTISWYLLRSADFVSVFIPFFYLIVVLCRSPEYFNYTTTGSIMGGGIRAKLETFRRLVSFLLSERKPALAGLGLARIDCVRVLTEPRRLSTDHILRVRMNAMKRSIRLCLPRIINKRFVDDINAL